MKRSVSKVNTQIADALEPFPRLFDMTEPHRQMEPVENVGDGLACCADDDTLQPDVSVAENGDVAAWHPPLRPQRRTNNVVLAGGNMR